ncbi:calcitonin gene-related peptide-receptor component protein [Bombyx mori]|uniref:DNA-directed RNA polymerase III subunit RPC9 n=1 Tax=Bombyx mori TaxID=7091 RepID=Q2F5S9_BOMMO|nr:calcitonin gene-related peptide-receptor component protein [Bombyx mori]ABD36288.1 calcitonin gene-related peptide-receptor component protein [Bombyx mori]
METIKANSAFLCNYEVMQILQKLKDNTHKKHKREASLATVTYETVHYLQDTECKNQSAQKIQKFLEAMKKYKLTKVEKLMMVNTPPRTELEIQLIVQESEERLSEEDVQDIISIVSQHLLANDNSNT